MSGFTLPHVIGFVADLFFSTLGSGFIFFRIRHRIRRIRVDCSRIRKEKVADSKISGYVWTGPQFRNASSCKIFHMKMSALHKLKLLTEHIFIWMVLHENTFWHTLGSRGYFFLIDTDGSRRSRVNDEKNNLWSQEYATSFPCEKSVQNLNWVTDWILPCQVVRCSQSGPLLYC